MLLRVDEAPSDGFHEVQFVLQSDRVLRAADPMIPELDKPINGGFWFQ